MKFHDNKDKKKQQNNDIIIKIIVIKAPKKQLHFANAT